MKKNQENKIGFTMVELMVVMTIMAVLTAIGVVSFQAASMKSRDGRRASDLEKIRIALEMYRQEVGGTYPAANVLESKLVPKYIQSIPIDPKNTQKYAYSPNGYTYSLQSDMENAGSTTATSEFLSCQSSSLSGCQYGGLCYVSGCCCYVVNEVLGVYACGLASADGFVCNYEVKNP